MASPSAHCGGVTIFYCKLEHFYVKEFRLHGLNVIRSQMATGRRRWYAMGCCIAPSNASTIEEFYAAIRYQPYGTYLLVAGNLNANLVETEGTPWAEAVTDELEAAGLMDMGLHFLPLCKPWLKDRCT